MKERVSRWVGCIQIWEDSPGLVSSPEQEDSSKGYGRCWDVCPHLSSLYSSQTLLLWTGEWNRE